MKIAFTICSLNYFAQALSLGESLSKTNPHYKYVIGLVDRPDCETCMDWKVGQYDLNCVNITCWSS